MPIQLISLLAARLLALSRAGGGCGGEPCYSQMLMDQSRVCTLAVCCSFPFSLASRGPKRIGLVRRYTETGAFVVCVSGVVMCGYFSRSLSRLGLNCCLLRSFMDAASRLDAEF